MSSLVFGTYLGIQKPFIVQYTLVSIIRRSDVFATQKYHSLHFHRFVFVFHLLMQVVSLSFADGLTRDVLRSFIIFCICLFETKFVFVVLCVLLFPFSEYKQMVRWILIQVLFVLSQFLSFLSLCKMNINTSLVCFVSVFFLFCH